MFNINSPIVNNMVNGGMYNPYIPPSPIGNVIPIGQQGYNNMGGYYNNIYNGYYNPYLAAQQEELRRAQAREAAKQESDIWKRMSKSVNKSLGYEVSDKFLSSRYDPVDPIAQQPNSEQLMDQRLAYIHTHAMPVDPMTVQFINYHNSLYDKTKQVIPDDISMYDYQNKMSELYVDMVIDKDKQRQKDISKLYNSNQYNQLINMHSKSNNYFNSIYKGGTNQGEITIDDMEVKLPQHIQNEYQKRKAMFLDAILKK